MREYYIQEKWARGFVAVSSVVGGETAVVVSNAESSHWKNPDFDALVATDERKASNEKGS